MKFDDMIYKEITWFNASEIAEHDTFDGIDSYELLYNLATLEAGYSLDDDLDEEADKRVRDEESGIITVGRFRFDSLLAEGLAEWFGCKQYELAGYVRSCWLSCDGDYWYFYFVTGPSGRAGRGLPTGGGSGRSSGGACRARRRGLLWLCFGVSCGIARARSFVCDHGRARRVSHVVPMTWPCRPGRRSCCGRVVLWLWCPGCRGRGVRRLYVAVMWLRHADEC